MCVCVRACVRACVCVLVRKRGYAHSCVVFGRPRVCVCMCTGVWMGDNRNSIRKCGGEMRTVVRVGPRFSKQAPV